MRGGRLRLHLHTINHSQTAPRDGHPAPSLCHVVFVKKQVNLRRVYPPVAFHCLGSIHHRQTIFISSTTAVSLRFHNIYFAFRKDTAVGKAHPHGWYLPCDKSNEFLGDVSENVPMTTKTRAWKQTSTSESRPQFTGCIACFVVHAASTLHVTPPHLTPLGTFNGEPRLHFERTATKRNGE